MSCDQRSRSRSRSNPEQQLQLEAEASDTPDFSSAASFQQSANAISNHHVDSDYLVKVAVVDCVFWCCYFWRDYSDMRNCVVSHYMWTQPPVDFCILLFTPLHFLHWFEVFRLLETLQCLALLLQLWWFGLDVLGGRAGSPSPSLSMTLTISHVRLVVSIIRLLHSIHGLARYVQAPTRKFNNLFDFVRYRLLLSPQPEQQQQTQQEAEKEREIIPLQAEFGNLFRHLGKIPSPNNTDFLTAVFFVLFSNVASSTHNPFDEKMIGPLTQYQAGDAFTIFVKLYVFDRLIGNFSKRALMYFIFALSLLLQWFLPGMLIMFSGAAYPYLHAAAELSLLWSAIQRWRMVF